MTRKLWTAEETRVLRANWRKVPAAVLAELLPRWSWHGIYDKASKLRLPMGAPKGCQSLRQAAKRAGYSSKGLKSLLKRQGVSVKHGYQSRAEESLRAYVSLEAVGQAVAADMRAESIQQASARLHVAAIKFARFLKSRGYQVIGGKASRFQPELLDRLATEYKAINDARRRAHGLALGRANKSQEMKRAA